LTLRSVGFWILLASGWAVFFSAGALGSVHRGSDLWESFLRPLLSHDPGRLERLLRVAAGVVLTILALVLNWRGVKRAMLPAAAAVIPFLCGACLYVGGLTVFEPGGAEADLRAAVLGAFQKVAHPSNLAALALFALAAGLALGIQSRRRVARAAGAGLILTAFALIFVEASWGAYSETWNGIAAHPIGHWPGIAGGIAALPGLFLTMDGRRGQLKKSIGTVLILAGAAGLYFLGACRENPTGSAWVEKIVALGGAWRAHGGPFTLGAFLALSEAWLLHGPRSP
jgi:hypothetical protein